MNTIIKTNKLSKTYKSAAASQEVLKDLDIEIYEGDFTVIMGPSGSGKSTLLYAISGMDNITFGTVECAGKNISDLNQDGLADFRSKNCGFVFQQIYLVESMSVLDNVLLSGLLVNKDKNKVSQAAKSLLKSVGIDETHFKKFPSQLSGGEAQRVAVVRAAVNKPRIIFADEPTGALNSQNSSAVLDVLTRLNEEGQSVVMVTHDITSALRANRVLYLKDGKIEGELRLDKYDGENESRKSQLKRFLAQLGW